jgi:hypothetical protein
MVRVTDGTLPRRPGGAPRGSAGAPRAATLAAAVVVLAAGACAVHATSPAAPAPVAIAAAPPPPAAAPAPQPAWVGDIEAELTALRGLPFRRPVPFATQSRVEFRHDVRADLSRELPPAKSADLSRAYASLGVVAPGFDLARALEDALATQVAAYYDPKKRAFRIVDSGHRRDTPEELRVASHELVHALQDQHFDLLRYDAEEDKSLDDDQRLARRFVVEGEATFLMLARDMGQGGARSMHLGGLAVAGLRMNITMLAAADMLELLAGIRQGRSAATLDEETRADLAVLEKLPAIVTLPLIEPYFKGAFFVSEVWAQGGWPSVDGLFRQPPQSTEQVLHPAEKFLARRDPPIIVRLAGEPAHTPELPGARLMTSEVLGELGWRIYFKTCGYDRPEQAAAGWGGDRFWAWERGGQVLTATATTWDSDGDARRFRDAYEATLAARFPGAVATADGDGLRLVRAGGRLLALERRGRDVDVIDGVTAGDLPTLRQLLRGATRRPATIDATPDPTAPKKP